jgi:hypothetical protein
MFKLFDARHGSFVNGVRAGSCVEIYPVSSGSLLRTPAWRRGLKVLILVLQKSVRSAQQRSALHLISLFKGVPDHL